MIWLLICERVDLGGDVEVLAAARRGLVMRVKHFAWHHVERGERSRACRVFLNGFALTWAPGLLARALAVWLPSARQSISSRPFKRSTPAEAGGARDGSDEPLAQMSDHP